jgi:two-component system, chemotaxis family, sensor kinase Cph1
MQKKNYDSTFCGSVPLNQINLIQPYGILVVLELENLTVIQVSENVNEALGQAPANIVNTSFDKYLSAEQFSEFREKLADRLQFSVPFTLTFNGKDYLAIMHQQDQSLLLELEAQPAPTSENSFITIYQQLKFAMEAINQSSSIKESCEIAARQLKQLSGYDKVMVYQFDKDWNGTVIAEEQEDGMESYLGLTFPASDIPRQARAMYLKNPYRMIPNREYVPVSLYPVINPLTNAFTDLSGCNLRSVPGVHLEYLKNMNIMTSMSCRILKDGQLWGLFSCHHRTPYQLPYEGRALFELLSDIIAARVVSLNYKEETDNYTRLHNIHARLVEQVYTDNSLLKGLLSEDTSVLQLLGASGAVMVTDRRMETMGDVPGKNDLRDLLLWLQSRDERSVFQVASLSSVYEPAHSYAAIASGLLVIPVQPQKGEFLLLFRPEVVQEVNWGGNPDEAIRFDKDHVHYHPRNSFNIWQQKVQNTALSWHDTEVQMAEHLRNFILEFIVRGLN